MIRHSSICDLYLLPVQSISPHLKQFYIDKWIFVREMYCRAETDTTRAKQRKTVLGVHLAAHQIQSFSSFLHLVWQNDLPCSAFNSKCQVRTGNNSLANGVNLIQNVMRGILNAAKDGLFPQAGTETLVKHLLYWTHLFGGANRASRTSHISFQPSEFVQCQKIPLLQSWVYLWKHHKQWDFLNPKNLGLCEESRAAREGIWLSPTINLLMDKISYVGGRIITTGTLTNFINSFYFPTMFGTKTCRGYVCHPSAQTFPPPPSLPLRTNDPAETKYGFSCFDMPFSKGILVHNH